MMDTTVPDMATDGLSQQARRAAEQAIGFLMQQAVENADCISLAAGLVDEQTLPVTLVSGAVGELLTDTRAGRSLLQYGTTAGPDRVRSVFRDYFHRLESAAGGTRQVSGDQLVLTTGSQQLLQLITQAIIDPGDIVLVAAPTYFVYLGVAQAAGARVIPVRSDSDGMCPEALQATLRELEDRGDLPRVKLVYIVSCFENPSGISVSTERRPQLLDIVRSFRRDQRILLLEDAAYRELHFGHDGVAPSIWSFDEDGDTVALAQTFSKSFSPGIRVGLGVLPRWLVKPVCDLKGNQDFGSPHLNQQILSRVIASGDYDRHAHAVREGYRIKCEAMLAAADEFFGDLPGVSWVRPRGGLYVWMSLPEHVQTGFRSDLFRVATHDEKVMYVPGELSYPPDMPDRPRHQMRLSFGVQNVEGIAKGMQRLARAVRRFV